VTERAEQLLAGLGIDVVAALDVGFLLLAVLAGEFLDPEGPRLLLAVGSDPDGEPAFRLPVPAVVGVSPALGLDSPLGVLRVGNLGEPQVAYARHQRMAGNGPEPSSPTTAGIGGQSAIWRSVSWITSSMVRRWSRITSRSSRRISAQVAVAAYGLKLVQDVTGDGQADGDPCAEDAREDPDGRPYADTRIGARP
jgi:hypothetical protein